MNEQTWTPEKEAGAIWNAIKDAHRHTGSDIDRTIVAPEDQRKAEQEAKLAEAREANEKAEAEIRDRKAVIRYLESK